MDVDLRPLYERSPGVWSKDEKNRFELAMIKERGSVVGRPREYIYKPGYVELERLNVGMAGWLDLQPWQYWVTQTFGESFDCNGNKYGCEPAYNTFTSKRRFHRAMYMLGKKYNLKRVEYFLGVEPHKTWLYHNHFLLLGTQHVTELEIKRLLEKHYGYCVVKKYDPKIAATGYVSKYVAKGFCDYQIKTIKRCEGGRERKGSM